MCASVEWSIFLLFLLKNPIFFEKINKKAMKTRSPDHRNLK